MKVFDQDLAFLSGDHRIRDLGLFEQVVLQHIIIAKLQLHTGAVGIQEILRRVLSGQMKLLDYLHTYLKPWKALSLDLLFQAENVLFVDPAVAF